MLVSQDEITIAFIKSGDCYNPSHVSEIKKDDVYYLVVGKTPTNCFIATNDSVQNEKGQWVVCGIESPTKP